MKFAITKQDIENIAKEIKHWASVNRLYDYSLFYNGKMFAHDYSEGWNHRKRKTKTGVNPLDYCEYFSEKFLIGMAYDGDMYECMNGYSRYKAYSKLEAILEKHHMYLEHCDYCHTEICCGFDDSEVEYTVFHKEKPVYIRKIYDCPDSIIYDIMETWKQKCLETGDKGSCVIGAYMEFRYHDVLYRMIPPTVFQGSISWESSVPLIENMLKAVGATEIHYHWGSLD